MAHYRSSIACHKSDMVKFDSAFVIRRGFEPYQTLTKDGEVSNSTATHVCASNISSTASSSSKDDIAIDHAKQHMLLSCSTCSKLFNDKSYLNKHMRWHKKVEKNKNNENVIIQIYERSTAT